MSGPWFKRKTHLRSLLKSQGDEDADSLALDGILHDQSVTGKTPKTSQVDSLRWHDKDLTVIGTLEYGQFGVINVVSCHLDGRIYIRKSTAKHFALRTRDQCSPQRERDILLLATKKDSCWVPHLLCAYQTPTHLNLVMQYAEGGNLWDVLESSPHDGRLPENDLKWWAPQIVSAIDWCHSQGFAHRDIKPHNFVLTPSAHVLLIDFGSAAPLLPPEPDGSQRIPKKYCLVSCGACDYISPEILQAHEEALVALEMSDDGYRSNDDDQPGYGLETDWWSLGAMLYEMVYGIAPFFAQAVRTTYLKIMDYKTSLQFEGSAPISTELQDLLRCLLIDREHRIGRRNVTEIRMHPFFRSVNWGDLRTQPMPDALHVPRFIYDGLPLTLGRNEDTLSYSQPFPFSACFQSSPDISPGSSILREDPSRRQTPRNHSSLREHQLSHFIGFSWGPTIDAFPSTERDSHNQESKDAAFLAGPDVDIPHQFRFSCAPHEPCIPPSATSALHPFSTPLRPSTLSPHHTLPRMSTTRGTTPRPRREVSDHEAMKQLVDCVGMSARKKVLESGRKPRILLSFNRSEVDTVRKELRFDVTSSSLDDDIPQLPASPGPSNGSEDSFLEGPPSPSPSPRPGSAMSMTLSMRPSSAISLSRRSVTPTLTTSSSSRRTSFETAVSINVKPEEQVRSEVRSDAELEQKHVILMEDISYIETRLEDLRKQVDA